jgi:glucose-6-phosphate isomerase
LSRSPSLVPSLRADYPSWKKLQQLYDTQHSTLNLKQLFASSPDRFSTFSRTYTSPSSASDKILLDFSKNLITPEVFSTLISLAKDAKVEEFRNKMFAGEHINTSEDRAVLHVALRNVFPTTQSVPSFSISEEGADEVPAVLEHMKKFSNSVRSGEWKGYTGKPINTIVNIGIGGSDLGPVMVTEALKHYAQKGLKAHFVSNIDGTDLAEVLKECNAETTLFIVASKTFTTQETITNAESARSWFLESAKDVSDRMCFLRFLPHIYHI